MIYVLPVYVLVPMIMYIVCVVVMICLLCSPFTSAEVNNLLWVRPYRCVCRVFLKGTGRPATVYRIFGIPTEYRPPDYRPNTYRLSNFLPDTDFI